MNEKVNRRTDGCMGEGVNRTTDIWLVEGVNRWTKTEYEGWMDEVMNR